MIPKRQSISSFVREVLTKEVLCRQSLEGAEACAKFIENNPKEKSWLEEWETADLIKPPKPAPIHRSNLINL